MATVLIRNGALCGAIGAFTSGRLQQDPLPADYATIVNAADAFATSFLTSNAALAVPMADADNAQIGQLCEAAAYACLEGRAFTSTTATDYRKFSDGAAALAKQGAAKLT